MSQQIHKIVLFGPESTGKTLLATNLAIHYDALWVPEFARGYLENKSAYFDLSSDRSDEICTEDDIPAIVLGQMALEDAFVAQSKNLLFFDTNPLQTAVYVQYYYKKKYAWLEKIIESRTYDHYLLLNIDVQWELDPLRDRPYDREALLDLFETELHTRKLPYNLIQGLDQSRVQNAIQAVDSLRIEK